MASTITVSLIQSQLDHIARQMGWVMERTARSPIFSESHDFSCFIADSPGDLISVADGIPIHTGGGRAAVTAVLRDYGDKIAEGDVFLLNDPYIAGGNHLPDWTIIRPVFFDNELLAFCCNRAHQSDIGGGAAGTYNTAATEIFHEGIRLPVLRLQERGAMRRDLWQLLMLNTRCPDLVDGDLRAMLGSTEVGAARLLDLAREHGVATLLDSFSAIQDYAERRMRQAIASIPNGTYRAMDFMDNDCFEPGRIEVCAAVTITDDEMEIDFTGSSSQMKGFKNSSLSNTLSATYLAVVSFLDADLPKNQGTFRPLKVIAPEGTVVNARFPAAMTMCTAYPAHEIIHSIWKALGQADPAKACAGWGKSGHCITSGRRDDGNIFVLYHMHAYPAAGAVNGRDGFNIIGTIVTLGGMRLPNIEAYESTYPILINRQEFRCDSGGAGRFRGGTGVDYDALVEVPAEYAFRGEGVRTPSGFGVSGGRDGARASITIESDGEPLQPPQYGQRDLGPTRITMASSGGGGFGPPWERPVDLVLRDVADGVVSAQAAEATYFVAIDPATLQVDSVRTAEMRALASGTGALGSSG